MVTPESTNVLGRTPRAWLARLGFADIERTSAALVALGLPITADDRRDPDGVAVVDALAQAADPNLALRTLESLVSAAAHPADLLCALRFRAGFRSRLLGVLGGSSALGHYLVQRPAQWQLLVDDALAAARPSAYGLRRALLDAVGADPHDPLPWGSGGATARDASPATVESMRHAYRRAQLLLAARDLSGTAAVEDVAAELADLAAAAVEAGLAIAAAGLPPGSAPARLAVIAMGKCGGHELNYSSDVDVVFVGAPLSADGDEQAALHTCTRLAEGLIRVCGQPGPGGVLFPVDAGLRPEGRHGPLVRTLASHHAYYERWARTWEFQALLKARPLAGDLELGGRYCADVAPMIWSAAERETFVDDVRAMRRRVEAALPRDQAGRQLKLGPGGLRDVEFAVQLLQLVHGRLDDRLRIAATLPALQALRDFGYVGRDDGDKLAEAYRWLRRVEHRLQLQRLRRTHVIPADEHDRRWLARASGYVGTADFDAARTALSADVRRLHEKLFYRPLLEAVGQVPAETAVLTPGQTRIRLTLLGFSDPDRAIEHLAALTRGVSRRAEMQRALLPVMLGWFANAADPDAGLLAFRRVSESLGETPWYLRLLRDDGVVAQRIALLLSRSRYASDLLTRAPVAMKLLADDTSLFPRPLADLATGMSFALDRARDVEGAIIAVRAVRRHELFRIASADLLGQLDIETVGRELSEVAAVTIGAALRIAISETEQARGAPLNFRIAVIALGRLGGGEIGYGSDADVVFVHDAIPGAATKTGGGHRAVVDSDLDPDDEVARVAQTVAYETRRLLALPTPDPPLVIDAGLRPEGRQGPLTRSLAAYRAYHARWASVWEAQALLRATAIAGDADLGAQFIAQVANPARYPTHFGADQVHEVRQLKTRMERERVAAGERGRNLKLGPGGLSDVEWTIQLLQLREAARHPALRVTGTVAALAAARDEGLIAAADARVLRAAWLIASRIRNAGTLVRGKPGDLIPADGSRELAGVAQLLGYPADEPDTLVAEVRTCTEQARAVVTRLFYQDRP